MAAAIIFFHHRAPFALEGFERARHVAAGFAKSIGNLNHLFFYRSYIAEPRAVNADMRRKIPVLLRLAWAIQRSEARDWLAVGALARTQSERQPFGLC